MQRPEKVNVGKIVTSVGLKGEVKVYPYTDYKERFEELGGVYIEKEFTRIKNVRYMKDMAIISFEGITDRNQADAQKDKMLYIDEKDLRLLDEDEYFIFDLIGIEVRDEEGNSIGKVSDLIENPAHSLFEIEKNDGKKFLLPYVDEFVMDIDIESGIMIVKLIEGLL